MGLKQFSLFLITFIFFVTGNAMKRPTDTIDDVQICNITCPNLPEEILLQIIACSLVKNKFRQTCRNFRTLASRKNKALFIHPALELSRVDLNKFALYYADLNEHVIVQNLLLHGADPNEQGSYCMTLMSYAVQNKDNTMITLLVNHPNITPLNKAQGTDALKNFKSKHNDSDTCEQLISVTEIDKTIVLSSFAQENNSSMVEQILLSGINTQESQEALSLATLHNALDAVRILIAHNVNPNVINDNYHGSPLHIAARRGYTTMTKLFIENNGDVTSRNACDDTPLHCAIKGGHINTVQFLIDEGACVNARGGEINDTSLMMAIRHGRFKIVALLLHNHANVNQKTLFGDTALHCAVSYKHSHIIHILLACPDIHVNIQNNDNETPLDIARKTGQTYIESILSRNGGKSGVNIIEAT